MAIESDLHNKYSLWMERPVTETLDLYADWAANYDSDLAKAGYFTPSRIAAALIKVTTPDKKFSILDVELGYQAKHCNLLGFLTLKESIFQRKC